MISCVRTHINTRGVINSKPSGLKIYHCKHSRTFVADIIFIIFHVPTIWHVWIKPPRKSLEVSCSVFCLVAHWPKNWKSADFWQKFCRHPRCHQSGHRHRRDCVFVKWDLHLHFKPAHSLRKNFEQFNFFERRHQTLLRARRISKEQKIVEWIDIGNCSIVVIVEPVPLNN